METKIFYSIKNGGDGSAFLSLMESKKLAELDQEFEENEGDGFAEDCSGSITIEHEGEIKVLRDVTTVKGEIKRITDELNEDYMKKYKKEGKYPEWFERLEKKLESLKKLDNEQ